MRFDDNDSSSFNSGCRRPWSSLPFGKVRSRPYVVLASKSDCARSTEVLAGRCIPQPSHSMPLTPPLSNPTTLAHLSLYPPALLIADHAPRIHHCTGDTGHFTAQSAGPCSAIRQRALTADICENRLLTDAFTGSTAGQLSDFINISSLRIKTCDWNSILTLDVSVQK
jgi:hypothetical protein